MKAIFIRTSYQVGFDTRSFILGPCTNQDSCLAGAKNAWSLKCPVINLALQSRYCLRVGSQDQVFTKLEGLEPSGSLLKCQVVSPKALFIHTFHQIGLFNVGITHKSRLMYGRWKNVWSLRCQAINLALQGRYCLRVGSPDQRDWCKVALWLFINSPGQKTRCNVNLCLSMIPSSWPEDEREKFFFERNYLGFYTSSLAEIFQLRGITDLYKTLILTWRVWAQFWGWATHFTFFFSYRHSTPDIVFMINRSRYCCL